MIWAVKLKQLFYKGHTATYTPFTVENIGIIDPLFKPVWQNELYLLNFLRRHFG